MTGQKLLARCVLIAALFGGMATVAFTGVANAQTVIWKRCSNCGRFVPNSSQVGDACPYCGAHWGSEESHYVSGGGAGSSSPQTYNPGYFPMPRNSRERMTFYQAAVQQQMIQRQMLLDQMWQQEREERRQRLAERRQKQREREEAEREATRQQLGEKKEPDRQNDDPQQRAERYLVSAVQSQNEHNLRAAIAYYRLAVRSAPDTPAAARASAALARLGSE